MEEDDIEYQDRDFNDLFNSLSEAASIDFSGISLQDINEILAQTSQIQIQTNNIIKSSTDDLNLRNIASAIAEITVDAHDTKNPDHKAARLDVANDLKDKIGGSLESLSVNDTTTLSKRQSEFAARIAWRLRHGHKFTWNDPSTYAPYCGEISEKPGFLGANKVRSLLVNSVCFFSKTYYYNPQPLGAREHSNLDSLIEEAITEIYNERIQGYL